jgi:ubiquinone/menaquinone biosynthesis C-methylase UbiE
MDKPMPNFMFNGMSFILKTRDFFRPREDVLREVEIKAGATVLDFGCGPGSYTLPAAKQLGESGKVYALDIQPLAVKRIQDTAAKMGLANIETINSDCDTGLADNSVDVVLLHDVFHMFSNPNKILAELHRVLKPNGVLSFSNHHMREEDILAGITGNKLFKLSKKGDRTYKFVTGSEKTS